MDEFVLGFPASSHSRARRTDKIMRIPATLSTWMLLLASLVIASISK